MHGAGIPIEFSKGEAWHGQHEINTRYADAVTAADRHTIYKNGVKEIAFLNEISATFMAKPSEKDIGSSCHVHTSLVRGNGRSAFVNAKGEENDTFRHFLGGMRENVREMALFVAPSINSYKRFAAESWAPTSVSWGRDNRTCGFRIVGEGQSKRIECRIPGADANPYLAIAALLAAGPGRDREQDRSRPRAEGQRVRGRQGRGLPRPRCARRSTSGRRASSPRRPSARACTSTTSTTAASSRACSTRWSPTTSDEDVRAWLALGASPAASRNWG